MNIKKKMENNLYEKATQKLAELTKFFTQPISEKTTESFKSIKVVDSDQEIEISELKVGADVSISSSTGSVPAPDADYKLVDGSEFKTKDGKVSEVVKEADEQPTEEEKPGDEPAKLADEPVAEPAKEDAPNEDVKALTDRVAKLEDAMATVLEVLQGQPTKEDVNSFNSKVKDIDSKIQLASQLPTQLSADSRIEMKESEIDKWTRLAEKYKK